MHQTMMNGPCLGCGQGFTAKRKHAKTCSSKCRQAYNREKWRVAALAPSAKKKAPSKRSPGSNGKPDKPPPKRKIARKR